jgi:succinyl-CoA synthetase beta subunit
MNIHEYQAKELLRRYGVAVLDGHVAWTRRRAPKAAKKLPGPVYVVKSQIHAGGRGAGRFKERPERQGRRARRQVDRGRSRAAAEAMIGKTLVTKQTGPQGKVVSRVYVEDGCDIKRELYLGLLVDRAPPRHRHGLDRGRHGDRGGGAEPPREDPQGRDRPGRGHLRLPCRKLAFGSASRASRSPPSRSS